MIHAEFLKTYEIRGGRTTILTELTVIMHDLLLSQKCTKQELLDAVELAGKSRTEVDAEFKDIIKEHPEVAEKAKILQQVCTDAQQGNQAAMDMLKLFGGM